MNSEECPLFIGGADGRAELKPETAGAKAAALSRMTRLGLEVPPAFVLPTGLCAGVNAGDPTAVDALNRGLTTGIAWLEQTVGRRFGDSRAPLLVSVRSGAARSMPGMLDTILNVGLNDDSVHGLIRMTGNPRLGFDSYGRLIRGYAEVVDSVPRIEFDQSLAEMIKQEGIVLETELDPEALERLLEQFRNRATGIAGHSLPDTPREQLEAAARAVYRSWESPRACEYRRLNRRDSLEGTAVTVQAMVFGNSGPNSGSGVAFSRDPATGARELYVDFLFDAQGKTWSPVGARPGTRQD
jgi:pyruvate, orthophosphate dikinase